MLAVLLSSALLLSSASPVGRPWMNVSDTPDARARLLLSQMNLTDKVLLFHGSHSEDRDYGWYVGRVEGNARLGIPPLNMNDGPQGFRDMNSSMKGSTTAWPSGLAVASTWDPAMAELWGKGMGAEFAGKGANVQLGPGLCVARVPYDGRNFEYASGEDPALGRAMVGPAIRGIQSQNVVANAKHWVLNSQESNRTSDVAVVDERTRNEIYYPPFEGAIEAGVGSVMCSYNKIQASPSSPRLWSCENPETLKRDLKERLGFEGWVMSDWGATHSTSINQGLDQEMPAGGSMNGFQRYPEVCDQLCALIANGTVSNATVDDSALRILRAMFTVGLFDRDVTASGATTDNVTSAAHTEAARRIAQAGMVLLQNDAVEALTSGGGGGGGGASAAARPLLPLGDEVRTVALVGTQAASPYVHGGGSGSVNGARVSAPLDALRARFGIVAPAGPARRVWQTKTGRGGCGSAQSVGTAHNITAVNQAEAACDAIANCTFWTLSSDPSDGAGSLYMCSNDPYDTVSNAGQFPLWLVGHRAVVPPSPPACSGPAPAPTPAPACAAPTDAGFDYDGNDLVEPPLRAASAGACCAACQAHDRCVAYTFEAPADTAGACWLKYAVGAKRADAGRVSGAAPAPVPVPPGPGQRCVYYDDGSDFARAASLAAGADVTIAFGATDSGEGSDRKSLALDDVGAGGGAGADNSFGALVRALGAASGRVGVAAVAPGAFLTPWRGAPGVRFAIASFMPGQEYGAALVGLLLGDGGANPSARLPLTLPTKENEMEMTPSQWPGVESAGDPTPVSTYSEGLEIGYRWYDAHGVAPAYAFGHGLSYTTFAYANLTVDAAAASASFTLRNTGKLAGAEVAQLYLGFPASAGEPPKQLKGFKQVQLAPGESKTVTFALAPRDLSVWDAAAHGWAVAKGSFGVMVGSGSRDIRLTGTLSSEATQF